MASGLIGSLGGFAGASGQAFSQGLMNQQSSVDALNQLINQRSQSAQSQWIRHTQYSTGKEGWDIYENPHPKTYREELQQDVDRWLAD